MSNDMVREIREGLGAIRKEQDDVRHLAQQTAIAVDELRGNRKSQVGKMLAAGQLSVGGYSDEGDDFFGKVLQAAALKATGFAPHEALKKAGLNSYGVDAVMHSTQKAIDTGTGGSGGGFVVEPAYLNKFIELLRAKLVVTRAGATMLTGLNGSPAMIPKQLTSASVSWVGENATIPLSDASFGQISMTPKTVAGRAQYSNLLHILSNPGVEGIIRDDFARVVATELDRVALRGSGASNQPLGLIGFSGVQPFAFGTNGGTLDIDALYALIGLLEDSNAMSDKLALVTSPKGLRKLKKLRIANYSGQTDGSYMLPPLLTDEALSRAIGLTCLTTTQIPTNLVKGSSSDCTEIYLGNWSELLIAQWGNIEVLATNIGGNAWAQNAIEVRLVMNVDIQTRHPQSFVYSADARTA